MSACLETQEPAVPADPSSEARAARLAKFKREQLIVDYLNRGVSVAEIAAHVGVGEKRMRAIVREILARRMPHPPEEFAAIQVSRLNEALLIAFSAMSGANLKAVDRVVKIVRELDRYHGFVATAQRRLAPDSLAAPGLDALPQGPEADVRALAFQMGLALHDGGPLTAALAGFSPDESRRSPAAAETLSREKARPNFYARFRRQDEAEFPATTERTGRPSDERPEIPLQPIEKVDSAPGKLANQEAQELAAPASPLAPLDPGADLLPANGLRHAHTPDAGQAPPSPANAGEKPAPGRRPGGVAEGDEWGVAGRFDANCVAPTAPQSGGGGDLLSPPHPSGAARHLPQQSWERGARPQIMCASGSANGEKGRSIASPDDAGPQNPPQPLEITDSRSGNGGLEPMAPPPPEYPVVGVRVPTPDGGFKIMKVRMTPNGAMAA